MDGLTLRIDRSEYSRLEPARSTVKVRLLPTPATGLAETVTLSLRRKGGPVLFTQEIALAGDYPKGETVAIDLPAITDSAGLPLCIAGDYRLEAQAGEIITLSPAFRLSLITVEEMRNTYCFGVPLYASDAPFCKRQPSVVTGVTFYRVSESSRKGTYALVYSATDNTLSWGGGPAIPISGQRELLPDPRGGYAEVDIDSFDLPATDAAEGIIIDKRDMSDDMIAAEIQKAVAEIENSLVKVYLEPYRIATEPYFVEGEHHRKAAPLMFTRRDFNLNARAWSLDIPVQQLQRIDQVEGYIGNTKALTIGNGALAVNRKSGSLDVLPYNSQYSYLFTFFQQLHFWGTREYIANFWRYEGVAGLPECPPDVLKLIGYSAAVTILSVAGQAYRGGFSSESTSKDGVSRSVSYTASATFGIYSATITEMKDWIKDNLPKIKNQYRGLPMVVL